MRTFKRLTLGLIAGLMLSSVSPAIPTAAASRMSWNCWKVKTEERAFATKMNLARLNNGASRMYLDRQLSKVARAHSRRMANDNSLFHSSTEKLTHRVTKWRTLGENVGMGGSVSSLHRAFMNSSGHRHNILSGAYRHVGVGTVVENSTLFVTVVFEGDRDPGTTLRPPRCRS
jgi:uncharacterized protein YkwD